MARIFPIVVKRTIESGGEPVGGSAGLLIQDRLGTQRVAAVEPNDALLDASGVSFSSPELIPQLLDIIQLVYRDLETNNPQIDAAILRTLLVDALGGQSESAQILSILSPDSLLSLIEASALIITLQDALGAQVDVAQLRSTLVEALGQQSETEQLFIPRLLEQNGAFIEGSPTHTISGSELVDGWVEAMIFRVSATEHGFGPTDAYSLALNVLSVETNTGQTEALIVRPGITEALGAKTGVHYIIASLIGNAFESNTGWTNPNNAIDNDLNTFASLTATASGVGGVTSVTVNANALVTFPDLTLPAGWVITGVVLDVHGVAIHTASVTSGSASMSHERRIDGATWVSLGSNSTGTGTGAGNYFEMFPRSFNLTGTVTTQAHINAFTYRTFAQAVSGGTGTPAPTTTVRFNAAVLRVTIGGNE